MFHATGKYLVMSDVRFFSDLGTVRVPFGELPVGMSEEPNATDTYCLSPL
jgi:hypothetical protein